MLHLSIAPSTAPPYRSVAPIDARLEPRSPFRDRPRRPSAAQKEGIRFESRVRAGLLSGPEWRHGQWISYRNSSSPIRLWCQVDAFSVDGSRLRIVEIKRRWCTEAIRQLRELYGPLLGSIFPRRRVELLCVCGGFDSAVPGSAEAYVVNTLDTVFPSGRIGVVVWKPRRPC